jgi:thymidylate synthase (FAD)
MNQAKLVWITPETEKHIAYCARVSNPANQDNPEISRLLKYCIKHGHWSIFEMASMCVEIKTTRAISPQILRHRSFSFQEFSQRYATVNEFPYMGDMRMAGSTNRQSSQPLPEWDDLSEDQQRCLLDAKRAVWGASEAYNGLIRAGIAAETARMVLPLCTPTTMYMTGTIRSWIHYVQLRTKIDTQQEHRDIAVAINNILWDNIPVIMQAVEEHWV